MNLNKMVLIMLLASLLLTACQQTPSTTIVNNEKVEITTDETIEAIDMDELPIINIDSEDVDKVIECGDISVTLKGTVSKPDSYEDIYSYTVNVIDYNQYESNMMFLFGEYENQVVRPHTFLMVYLENGYRAELRNSSLVDDSGGYIEFDRYNRPVTEDMRKVNMTYEEAQKNADEIMARIGTTAFVYDGCEYYEEVLQITPEGTLSSPFGDSLSVYYVQEIQGIPIRTTLIELRRKPMAWVGFDSKGVDYVSISEYEYDVYSRLEQCISYEEALQLFMDYISKDSLNDGNVYTSVEFQYTIKKVYMNGNFVEMAIPYWVFDKEDHPDATWDPRGDIYINCVDGSIYSSDQINDNEEGDDWFMKIIGQIVGIGVLIHIN